MGLFDRFRTKSTEKSAPVSRRVRVPARYYLPSWLRGDYTLQNSELIFSATARLSNSLAAMPVRLYKGTVQRKDALADLIGAAPNPNMSSFQFIRTMEACRDTEGNAYALKTVDALDNVTRLDILDPTQVAPVMNEDTGELWYRIQSRGGEKLIHSSYIVHLPFLSVNGIIGVNPVSVLFNTLEYARNIQKFSVEQLVKGINATVVIEAPANLSPEQRNQAIEDLQSVSRESGGALLFLESGLSAKALNLSPVDSKLFEVEKITRGKVAMVYGIPPHLMGDSSDTSFSSQEQEMLEFLMLTMLPIVTAYEQEFNRKLLTQKQRMEGYRFRFDVTSLLRADARTMAEVNSRAIRSGYKLINEVRADNGDPGVKHGNKAFLSKDLAPLDWLVNNYNSKPERSNPNDSGQEIDPDEAKVD